MNDKKIDWKSMLLTIGSFALTIGAGLVSGIRNDKMMKEEVDQAVNDALENRSQEDEES